jgi:hypothetical protein
MRLVFVIGGVEAFADTAQLSTFTISLAAAVLPPPAAAAALTATVHQRN